MSMHSCVSNPCTICIGKLGEPYTSDLRLVEAESLLKTARNHLQAAVDIIVDESGVDMEEIAEERDFIADIDAYFASNLNSPDQTVVLCKYCNGEGGKPACYGCKKIMS